jgi:general secretion pathway protein K
MRQRPQAGSGVSPAVASAAPARPARPSAGARPPRHHPPAGRQRGTALLLALLIVALVVALSGGMVWQQTRALEVESAERARAQSAWVLNGALDWSRLVLAEDMRESRSRQQPFDSLGEVWATPLAEARLSTFLAADQDNTLDSGPEAFISGSIEDAQSRYNLRNLVDPATGELREAEVAALDRLLRAANLPEGTTEQLVATLGPAFSTVDREGPPAPLAPMRMQDLVWLGIDEPTVAALRPWVDVLPVRTPVNLNTAPREVLLAAIDNLDLGLAERIVQERQRRPLAAFESLDAVRELFGEDPAQVVEPERAAVVSSFFIVSGRLRLEDRVLEERSLIERAADRGGDTVVRRRERISGLVPVQ